MVNRLQQPTHSYLARSRSAMSLSGEQTGNIHTSYMKDPSWLLWSVVSEKEEVYKRTQHTAHNTKSIRGVYILVSWPEQFWMLIRFGQT